MDEYGISGGTAPIKILIVEDEPVQRLDMSDIARIAGFEPVEAWDADHAVAILQKRSDIRIVFTDIDMPGSMDGMRLASCIRRRWPPIEIILTTAGRRPDAAALPPRSQFLPKPIVAADAIRTMRALAG